MSFPVTLTDLRFQDGLEDFPTRAEFQALHKDLITGPIFDTSFGGFAGWFFNVDNLGGEIIQIRPVKTTGGYEYWTDNIGLTLLPFRCAALDTYPFSATNIESAKANLTLSHFAGVKKTVVATVVQQEDAPDIDPAADDSFQTSAVNTLGETWWQTWEQYNSEPATIGMTISLFGAWHDGNPSFIDGWHLDALGGGDSFTYTATNNFDPIQNIVIDCTGFCQAYVNNKNNYVCFCWAVTPATAAHLVDEVVDAPAEMATVLWGMYAAGDWTVTNHGYLTGHPLDEAYRIDLVTGTISGWEISWVGAEIGTIDVELGGNLSLPDSGFFRLGPHPYAPNMT